MVTRKAVASSTLCFRVSAWPLAQISDSRNFEYPAPHLTPQEFTSTLTCGPPLVQGAASGFFGSADLNVVFSATPYMLRTRKALSRS